MMSAVPPAILALLLVPLPGLPLALAVADAEPRWNKSSSGLLVLHYLPCYVQVRLKPRLYHYEGDIYVGTQDDRQ